LFEVRALDDSTVSDGRWIVYIAAVLSIVSSLFASFLLSRLNGIVHGQLYGYGLQFNGDWAAPYWRLEGLLYASLMFSSVFSGSAVVCDVWLRHRHVVSAVKIKRTNDKDRTKPVLTKGNFVGTTCPNCNRVFSKPLTMYGGKSKLVNVCPYCNHVLDENEETRRFRLVEPEEATRPQTKPTV
jgi:hypothetical protein